MHFHLHDDVVAFERSSTGAGMKIWHRQSKGYESGERCHHYWLWPSALRRHEHRGATSDAGYFGGSDRSAHYRTVGRNDGYELGGKDGTRGDRTRGGEKFRRRRGDLETHS